MICLYFCWIIEFYFRCVDFSLLENSRRKRANQFALGGVQVLCDVVHPFDALHMHTCLRNTPKHARNACVSCTDIFIHTHTPSRQARTHKYSQTSLLYSVLASLHLTGKFCKSARLPWHVHNNTRPLQGSPWLQKQYTLTSKLKCTLPWETDSWMSPPWCLNDTPV